MGEAYIIFQACLNWVLLSLAGEVAQFVVYSAQGTICFWLLSERELLVQIMGHGHTRMQLDSNDNDTNHKNNKNRGNAEEEKAKQEKQAQEKQAQEKQAQEKKGLELEPKPALKCRLYPKGRTPPAPVYT